LNELLAKPDRYDHQNKIDDSKNGHGNRHVSHLLGEPKHQLILPVRGASRKLFVIEGSAYNSASSGSIVELDECVIGELRKISIFGYATHWKSFTG
jgi:hypothetical protein